jgi:hypothetical protein
MAPPIETFPKAEKRQKKVKCTLPYQGFQILIFESLLLLAKAPSRAP